MDPETQALLEEVAGSRGSLLRVSPEQLRRSLFSSDVVSEGEPFLQACERHLLRHYREEVARILYLQAHVVRTSSNRLRDKVHFRDLGAGPSRAQVRERAVAIVESDPGPSLEPAVHQALRACTNGENGLDSIALLGAALRLVPSDEQKIALAVDLGALGGRQDEARRLLGEVLASGCSARCESYAHENLGLFAVLAGDQDRAVREYEAAVLADPGRPGPLFPWLAMAVQCGDVAVAERAAERIDSMVELGQEALEWYVEAQLACRARDEWQVRQGSRSLADRIADRAGSAARRVLDVFGG